MLRLQGFAILGFFKLQGSCIDFRGDFRDDCYFSPKCKNSGAEIPG